MRDLWAEARFRRLGGGGLFCCAYKFPFNPITGDYELSTTLSTSEVPQTNRETATQSAATRLRGTTVAVRLHIRWPGIRKTLSESERCRAADAFDADTKLFSAAKKLLDTRHPLSEP